MTTMRILHVIATGARRGGETFASDLVRALSAWDVDQQVAILRGPDEGALDLPVPVTTLAPHLVEGVPRFDLAILRSLGRSIRASHPDIVQVHGGEALKYAVASSIKPPPIVYRRIGAVLPHLRRGHHRAIFASQLRRTARIAAVSDVVRRETIEVFGVAEDRIVMIPNGVDSARIEPTIDRDTLLDALDLPEDSLVVTFLGAFTWEKDPLANLQIATDVLEAVREAVFLIVGDGPLRARVHEAVRSHPLRERIRLLGSRPDVGNVLGATDVLLSASRTEGMPAVVIEAGIAGRAVAAYALSGIPEIIVDGETGSLVEPGDQVALGKEVVELLGDREKRIRMGDRARRRCLEMFDIQAIAPLYLAVYEDIVAAGRS